MQKAGKPAGNGCYAISPLAFCAEMSILPRPDTQTKKIASRRQTLVDPKMQNFFFRGRPFGACKRSGK
jgi:hypothetical protein